MNRPSTESQKAFKSGAEDARTPNAVARSADAASAKRLECVRFIGAFRPAPRLRGSWSLCRAAGPTRLSMNRPWPVPTLCCICNTKLVVRFMVPTHGIKAEEAFHEPSAYRIAAGFRKRR